MVIRYVIGLLMWLIVGFLSWKVLDFVQKTEMISWAKYV